MLPERFDSVEHLEEVMTTPSPALVDTLQRVSGDILVLGVGGKMGPTLARLAKRAAPAKRVIGVARFSEPGLRQALDRHGVETVAADLLDRAALERLPKAPNVVFMAGRKFGSTGNESLTWAMNAWLPGLVAQPVSCVERCMPRYRWPSCLVNASDGTRCLCCGTERSTNETHAR